MRSLTLLFLLLSCLFVSAKQQGNVFSHSLLLFYFSNHFSKTIKSYLNPILTVSSDLFSPLRIGGDDLFRDIAKVGDDINDQIMKTEDHMKAGMISTPFLSLTLSFSLFYILFDIFKLLTARFIISISLSSFFNSSPYSSFLYLFLSTTINYHHHIRHHKKNGRR